MGNTVLLMDDILDLNLSELYRVYKTVHEMLKDRDYYPIQIEKTREQFISYYIGLIADTELTPYKFCDELTNYFEYKLCKNDKKPEKLMVYWSIICNKLKKNDLQAIVNKSIISNSDKILLILKCQINSRITNVVSVLGNNIQVFSIDSLKINITKHNFVPQHTLLTFNETKDLLDYYHTDRNNIPGILITDPIVQWYNWKIGDIIKIKRPIPGTKNFELTYRVVCNPKEE